MKRINCGMKGRYVTVVTRDETKPITLCELEVFAVGELCSAMRSRLTVRISALISSKYYSQYNVN